MTSHNKSKIFKPVDKDLYMVMVLATSYHESIMLTLDLPEGGLLLVVLEQLHQLSFGQVVLQLVPIFVEEFALLLHLLFFFLGILLLLFLNLFRISLTGSRNKISRNILAFFLWRRKQLRIKLIPLVCNDEESSSRG